MLHVTLRDGRSSSIAERLRRDGLDVQDDRGTRAMYASDASLYRIPPLAESLAELAVARGIAAGVRLERAA